MKYGTSTRNAERPPQENVSFGDLQPFHRKHATEQGNVLARPGIFLERVHVEIDLAVFPIAEG
jgi:hypothetical protein